MLKSLTNKARRAIIGRPNEASVSGSRCLVGFDPVRASAPQFLKRPFTTSSSDIPPCTSLYSDLTRYDTADPGTLCMIDGFNADEGGPYNIYVYNADPQDGLTL